MSTKEESNLLLNQTAEDLLIGDDVEFENADNEQASSHSEEEEQSSEEEEQSDEEEDEEKTKKGKKSKRKTEKQILIDETKLKAYLLPEDEGVTPYPKGGLSNVGHVYRKMQVAEGKTGKEIKTRKQIVEEYYTLKNDGKPEKKVKRSKAQLLEYEKEALSHNEDWKRAQVEFGEKNKEITADRKEWRERWKLSAARMDAIRDEKKAARKAIKDERERKSKKIKISTEIVASKGKLTKENSSIFDLKSEMDANLLAAYSIGLKRTAETFHNFISAHS